MTTVRLLALHWLVAGSTLALSPLAGATASVAFLSAGCVGEGPSACHEVMFDQSFGGTGGFGTGGYGGQLYGPGINADMSGEANATSGQSLGALAAMRGSTAYYSPISRVTTVSRSTDTLTIQHPLGRSGGGVLSLWLRMDGVAQLGNPDPDVAAFALIGGQRVEAGLTPIIDIGSGLEGQPGAWGWQVNGPFVLTVPLPGVFFEFGKPFDLSVELWATTLAYYQGQERGYGSFDIRLDALHTAVFGQIEVTDSSGPITGYTVTADSGFDYRIQSAVPEPQTGWLAALGLVALALRSRRLGRAPTRAPTRNHQPQPT